jgi:hypothetical protein
MPPTTTSAASGSTIGGRSQATLPAIYTVGGGTTKRKARTVRLEVRRTRLADPTQPRLWPEWRHHEFITNRDDLDCVAADQFHREHAVVELAIRDLKAGGAEHIPSGHHAANAAWLGCAVIAHNLTCWTTILSEQPTVTNTTFRTRITAVPAVVVNRSGRPTLRLPTRWPWASDFTTVLAALRALPAHPADPHPRGPAHRRTSIER